MTKKRNVVATMITGPRIKARDVVHLSLESIPRQDARRGMRRAIPRWMIVVFGRTVRADIWYTREGWLVTRFTSGVPDDEEWFEIVSSRPDRNVLEIPESTLDYFIDDQLKEWSFELDN